MTHIALFVPAFNEEAGIARTASVMREAVVAGIVQSAHVLDGGSTDNTATVAARGGVEVVHIPSCMPELGQVLGKGDSLFRATRTIDADWYVFLDADLGNVNLSHVSALVSCIGEPGVKFVKGGFIRVDEHGAPRDIPAGRVTELVGRPLLAQVSSKLAELSQPLSGQVALEGSLARDLKFATGYGVEIAMLIDVFRTVGIEGIVEADMGEINNRWKPEAALNDVTDHVLAGASLRGVTLPEYGVVVHDQVVNRF